MLWIALVPCIPIPLRRRSYRGPARSARFSTRDGKGSSVFRRERNTYTALEVAATSEGRSTAGELRTTERKLRTGRKVRGTARELVGATAGELGSAARDMRGTAGESRCKWRCETTTTGERRHEPTAATSTERRSTAAASEVAWAAATAGRRDESTGTRVGDESVCAWVEAWTRGRWAGRCL